MFAEHASGQTRLLFLHDYLLASRWAWVEKAESDLQCAEIDLEKNAEAIAALHRDRKSPTASKLTDKQFTGRMRALTQQTTELVAALSLSKQCMHLLSDLRTLSRPFVVRTAARASPSRTLSCPPSYPHTVLLRRNTFSG